MLNDNFEERQDPKTGKTYLVCKGPPKGVIKPRLGVFRPVIGDTSCPGCRGSGQVLVSPTVGDYHMVPCTCCKTQDEYFSNCGETEDASKILTPEAINRGNAAKKLAEWVEKNDDMPE
jgi:hypothetical protein